MSLLTTPEVRTYLGGPRPQADFERDTPEMPVDSPGVFILVSDEDLLGMVVLNRRDAARPGHVVLGGEELEVSYTLLPRYWGKGYAAEAVEAVLEWAAGALADRQVVLCTQSANQRSTELARRLGFQEVARFEEFDAEQWFGVRSLTPNRAQN